MVRSGSPIRSTASAAIMRASRPRPSRKSITSTGSDPKSGDVKVVVDDFVEPNGIAFSPDEKKLYVIDTGFTDGRTTPRISACSTSMSAPERFRTARSLRKCPSPASPTACAVTATGGFGAPWVGATRTRTACAATRLTASLLGKTPHTGDRRQSVLRRHSNGIDFTSAARHHSMRSTRVRRAP